MVAEMVAVQDLISKVTKMKPTNLMWDGKPDSLQTFLFIFGEFIEVKCGEAAAGVLRGEMSDADGDPLIAPCVYATWSKELYLMLMGCTEKNSTEAQAATESAIAARETIGRSAFNLIMHWQSLGLATTKRDCDAIDLKITALEIAVNDERATIEVKCARAQQLWLSKPERYRGSSQELEQVLLGLLPRECASWRADYERTIETNESLYGMQRPDAMAIKRAVQAAMLDVRLKQSSAQSRGTILINHTPNPVPQPSVEPKCLNCGGKHESKKCPKLCPNEKCKLPFCGYNVCGACPLQTGVMPTRILNYEQKPIPRSLYNVVQRKFDAMKGSTGGASGGNPTLFLQSETFMQGGVSGLTLMVRSVLAETVAGAFSNSESFSFAVDVPEENGSEEPDLSPTGRLMIDGQAVTTLMMSEKVIDLGSGHQPNLLVALDGGSDQHATPYEGVLRGREIRPPVNPVTLGANSDAPLHVTGEATDVPMLFGKLGGGMRVELLSSVKLAAAFPCVILSQHKMWEDHGWRVRFEDEMIVHCGSSGDRLAVLRHQGLFVLQVWAPMDGEKRAVLSGPMGGAGCTLVTRAERTHTALLWSARFASLDGATLSQLADSTFNHGIGEVTNDMRRVLETCEVRLMGGMKKQHKGEVPTHERESTPGALLIIDNFGPYSEPAVGTSAINLMAGVDDATGYAHGRQTIHHTTDKYLEFVDVCDVETRAAGHERGVLKVRSDNAPELDSERWSEGLIARNKAERKTPPYDKGGTARVERLFGIAEPLARMMMARASHLNKSFFLHAMSNAITVINLKARAGDKRTRSHNFFGRASDVSKLKTFGCFGWARLDAVKRDTKGGPVASRCVYVGLVPEGWLVVVGQGAAASVQITAQARFYETNLLSKGVMPSVGVLDASTQTDEDAEGASAPTEASDEAEATACATAEESVPSLPISLTKETRVRNQIVRFDPSAKDGPSRVRTAPAPDVSLVAICEEWLVADRARAIVEQAEVRHDYTHLYNVGGAGKSLLTGSFVEVVKGALAPKTVTLNGPQGEYEMVEPRNTREARRVADADAWYDKEVLHVYELETTNVLRPCERHEAEGFTVYPSQMEYAVQKNMEDGSLKQRKVRGCLNGKSWDGAIDTMYTGGAGRDTIMLQLAEAQRRAHRRLKVDIKNAYPEATWPDGKRVFMHMFTGHVQYDSSGKPMIYEVMRNYWGAPPAGALFGQWLATQLVSEIGFEEVRACLGMYRLPMENDAVTMSTIVDDLLLTGQTAHLEHVLTAVRSKVKKLTFAWDPVGFAGFDMRECELTGALTVSVATKVQEYAYMLGVSEAARASITKQEWDSLKLDANAGDAGELSEEQRKVRQATGALGWFADIRLDAKPFAHRLQRVSRAPPPVAMAVHVKIAQNLLCDVHAGITFPRGGPPVPFAEKLKLDGAAPTEMQIIYDATWSDGVEQSLWMAAYTYNNAAFATAIGTIGAVNLSSSDAESYSLSMAWARGVVYRNVLTAMGAAPTGPTLTWGDNSATDGVANDVQSPKGLRHIMRRVKHVQEQVKAGHFASKHVDDKNNVVDFFGKYVSGKKAAASAAYLMNAKMAVAKA